MLLLNMKVCFAVTILCIVGHRNNAERPKADLERLNKALVPRFLPGPIEEVLEVYYEVRKSLGVKVDIGNVMYFEWLAFRKPEITWTCDENEYYTLIMANPQHHREPFPEHSTYTTWLVTNIAECNISSGYEVFEYEVPRPHYRTGRYIYVWAVFKQPVPSVNLSQPTVPVSLPLCRVDYTLTQIIQNLTLGKPFAANYINLNGTLEDYLYEEPTFEDEFNDPDYLADIGGTRFPTTTTTKKMRATKVPLTTTTTKKKP